MIKGKDGIYNRGFKRLIDIFCAMLAILIFWWLYVILAILVRLKLGSPIMFKQARPGKIDPKTGKEKIFYLYKFRTMTDARDKNGEFLPDEERLTKFGKILRSTSMDELPEVFNIIRGDMSIIGPRPLLVRYLPYYTDIERERHTVRPGLTGLAQVNGRNYLMWDDRLKLDVKYARSLSFIGDIKILFMTVMKVLKRSDVAEKRIIPFDEYRKGKE